MIKKLNALLTKRDKWVLGFLFAFSIFVSLIETVGIGIIMPFIAVASDFSKITSNSYIHFAYKMLDFHSDIDFVALFGLLLICFYIFRAVANYAYFYALARFSQGRYHLLAYRLFENYMGYSYKDFIQKSSSELTKTIINEANNLVQLISNFLFMFSEVFVVFFIYSFLLYVNWKMTLLLTLFLFVNILVMKFTISKKMVVAGENRERFQKQFYEIMNSSFGNFKIFKLRGYENIILKRFGEASYGYAKANIKNQSLSQAPRLFLEAIGFSLVAVIVIYLVLKYKTDISGALPILMAFILGLYRLMPSVNRIYSAYNQILFYRKSLDIVHNDLIYEVENLGDESVEFRDKIELNGIKFEYTKDKPVLKNINLTINKGDKIGFTGESGSGKSTLIDVIIGLYKPNSGDIVVDGIKLSEENIKSWRKMVGYIPQSIYLSDTTIAQNIAFGKEIDESRVKEVLKQANILEFLEKNHDGIYTQVGENGVKLSGGQKQRIAIARALYNAPQILVLDEATSSLDNETEAKIMDEIYNISKDKTLIIIAHRLSTIDRCERVYRLENGGIFER